MPPWMKPVRRWKRAMTAHPQPRARPNPRAGGPQRTIPSPATLPVVIRTWEAAPAGAQGTAPLLIPEDGGENAPRTNTSRPRWVAVRTYPAGRRGQLVSFTTLRLREVTMNGRTRAPAKNLIKSAGVL